MRDKPKFISLRHYPPGIILEYSSGRTLTINLLNLSQDSDFFDVLNHILSSEPRLASKQEKLSSLISELKTKLLEFYPLDFSLVQTFQPHKSPITHVSADRECKVLVMSSPNRTAVVHEFETLKHLFTLSHNNVVCMSMFNFFGNLLATACYDCSVRLWDGKTGSFLFTLTGHSAEVIFIDFSLDSLFLVSSSMDKTAIIWDLASKSALFVLTGHEDGVFSVKFSSCGLFAITASYDCTVKLWDRSTGMCLFTITHSLPVSAACLDFESVLIASASIDGVVYLSSASSGNLLCCLQEHPDEVLDVTFNLTGSLLATSCADGVVRVFDRNGNIKYELMGHSDQVLKCQFNPQGSKLVSVSLDNTCRIWSMQTGECLQVLEHCSALNSAQFSFDGSNLITSCQNNVVRIFSCVSQH
ncbi:hypothetical protein RCL1_005454 [Eukaryota sp. TZLM3-RCL]